MKRLLLSALVLVAVVSVAQTGGDQGLQAGVASATQSWINAMRAGDAAAAAQIYTANSIACSEEGKCDSGRTAIEQGYRSMFADNGRARTAVVNRSSLVRDRDLAYDWGNIDVVFTNGRSLRFRYVTVWQRQGGAWKIVRDLSLPSDFREGRETRRPSRSEQSATVRCDSTDMRRHTCAAPGTISRATLARQISGSACTQGTSWGWQGDSIWVDRGCRAEFTVFYSGEATYDQPDQNVVDYNDPRGAKPLRCESADMNYKLCPAGGTVRGARLVRQLSGSACTEGTSWGWKSDGIWVDKGCRAEFEVTLR